MAPLTEHEWIEEYREVLELIAMSLLSTGQWPDPLDLERGLRAQKSNVSVIDAVSRMPSYVGGRQYQPPHVRLSLAALGSSSAGMPVLRVIYRLLELARRRFENPSEPPRLRSEDLVSLSIDDALRPAVNRVVCDGGVVFLGSGSADPHVWDLEIDERLFQLDGCTDAESLVAFLKVRYWPEQGHQAAPVANSNAAAGQHHHPTVLISYAQSAPWQSEVYAFASALRGFGIDADMDIFHTTDHQEWATFGPRLVRTSDFILLAVDAAYRRRWDGDEARGQGAGVAREAAALKSILERDRQEFVRRVKVVLLGGAAHHDIPADLAGMAEYFEVRTYDANAMEGLLRSLTGQPAFVKSPLGEVPILGPKSAPDLEAEVPRYSSRAPEDTPHAASRPSVEVAAKSPSDAGASRNELESRALVEEAVVAASSLISAQVRLRSMHNSGGDTSALTTEAFPSYVRARERMIDLDTRLILRLGHGHRVRRALAELIESVDMAGREIVEAIALEAPPRADALQRAVAERRAMAAAREKLLTESSAWMRGNDHEAEAQPAATSSRTNT